MEKKRVDVAKLINKKCQIEKLTDKEIQIYKLPKGPRLLLPRFIEMNEDLAWLVGFYLAEGNKTRYGIGISNCEIELLKEFQLLTKTLFDIESSDWSIYIHSKCIEKSEKNMGYFKNTFKTNKINIVKSKLATKDNIELRINNILLALILNNLIQKLINIIPNNYDLIKAFLKGYEAGDGSIIQRDGFLYGIVITVKNNQIKDLLSNCFEKVYKKPRVRLNKGSYEICLAGVDIMTELVIDKHFDRPQRQWKKLIKSYIKKQYSRSHIRYWRIIKKQPLSAIEIAEKTARSYWAARDAMVKDTKLGLIRFDYKRYNNKGPTRKVYRLTEKGEKLLNLVEGV